jgi:hypothetical protein
VFHRDIGYLVVALTIVYAVSGLAVNHASDWNSNYRFERVEERFTPSQPTSKDAVVQQLVAELKLPGKPKDSFRSSPVEIEMFYEGWSVQANIAKGMAMVERPKERPILRSLNFLHLNDARRAWTWVADLYALSLIFMAISGTLMLRGKKGLSGRGKWLISLGLLIPIVFLAIYRWF